MPRLLCWLVLGHWWKSIVPMDAPHIRARRCRLCACHERALGRHWFRASDDWGFAP